MLLRSVNWSLAIAFLAVIFSVFSYWLTRRRELAWKRTEFLFSQSQYLDNDPDLIEAVNILEGRHANITVGDIFNPDSKLDKAKQMEYLQKLEKLFNFLWRLCYAYLTVKTFSRKEIEGFSWYLWRIAQHPFVVEYCENYGYEEINMTIKKMKFYQEDSEIMGG